MLRITGGTLRGRRIPIPKGEVRPTSERARQAYFNIVAGRVQGARFLDLFAGSGIFSFEAVSRGAREAVAIDVSRQATKGIDNAAAALGAAVRTVTADAIEGIKHLGAGVFDLVYADPPYDYAGYDELLMTLDSGLKLAPEALVAVEHRRRTDPFKEAPDRLRYLRRAEYGEVWITLFTA